MEATVLVTGANGYTGRNLVRYLASRGTSTRAMYWPPDGEPDFAHERVEHVAGDLRDEESLKRALDGVSIVHNIAALYRPTNVSNAMFWDVNVEGVRNIVRLAHEAGVRRFVQCSTIGVHGQVRNPPANEDSELKPEDYYQFTKLKGEEVARQLGRELGLGVVIVRPAAIYGPLEDRFLKLPKLLQSGKFVMFGSGEVLYHFVHVDDLCSAFVRCGERDEAVGNTYIIADDHAITLNRVVEIMCSALDMPVPTRRLPISVLMAASVLCEFACKPFGVSPPLHRRRASWFSHTRSFDISKSRRELGYEPKVPIEAGITEMIRSYKEVGWLR